MPKFKPVLWLPLAIFALAMCGRVSAMDRIVLGYSSCWDDTTYRPEDYNYKSLSLLARAFLKPDPDGQVEVPEQYFNPQLDSLAHSNGVKLLMSLGGEAAKADNWLSIATHAQYLDRFETELQKLLSDHHYDGIDIDWEPAPQNDADAKAYNSFLKSLHGRFPSAIITTALPASDYWIGHLNWPEVLASVNYINVMTYDYSGSWGEVAGHGSNLYPPSAYAPQPEYSADAGIQNLIKNHHVPPEKLLMGLTFWGYRFRADHIGDRITPSTPGNEDNLPLLAVEALAQTGHYSSFWDQGAIMPYLERSAGGSVVCYENPESIRRKCEYSKAQNCAGVMIWSLGADVSGYHAPLMDAIAQCSNAPARQLGRDSLEHQITEMRKRLNHNTPTTAGVPTDKLSALPLEQLEDLFANTVQSCGITSDDRWREKSGHPHRN